MTQADDDRLPASQARVKELETRVRHLEKMLDTLGSPLYKRLWWRVDGYAPWHVVERRRQRRPWHPKPPVPDRRVRY